MRMILRDEDGNPIMSIEEEKDAVKRILSMIDDGYVDISRGWGCREDVFSVDFIEAAVRKHYNDVFGEDPE